MSDLLRVKTPKKNHKKGIAAAARARKREEAEARQARYHAMNLQEKIARNSEKVQAKLSRGGETCSPSAK